MYRIAYRSHVNPAITPVEVAQMVERARAKNHRLGITGLLAWSQQSFLQCIEGPQAAVQGLMDEIAVDP
ncbi:MAG: BLUF domain-containing protein, partial [Brachymonas sp.]|nr:BLUF domain-containing protein [Brachymonas sp.]